MLIDLTGRSAHLSGVDGPILSALATAVADCGATVVDGTRPADLLVMVLPLTPDRDARLEPQLDDLQSMVSAMSTSGGGRVLLVMSATGLTPMRRHPEFSRRSAGAASAVRGLAMQHGPTIAINGLAVGAIGAPVDVGDTAMLSHVPLSRPGTRDEVVGAALFLLDPSNSYTTGQVLAVDGGWSVGYGRNF